MTGALLAVLLQAAGEAPRTAYSLAVVPVSFADRPFGAVDPGPLFFEKAAAYYRKASSGRFALRGRTYPAVTVDVDRGRVEERHLEEAVDAFLAREGEGVRAAFDGVALVLAGPAGPRGTPLWPRCRELSRISTVRVPELAGDRALGIAAHEFMHLLGFADKYDDEKVRVGAACILGTGFDPAALPPPCAECRVKLGWTSAESVDPSQESAVTLGPGLARAVRIPVNADGTESLLIEVQDRVLAWHVGGGQKIELVARLGADGPARLTPFSDPPFRGRTVGARPVWITGLRIEVGRVAFTVGPSAPLTADEEKRRAAVGKRLGD